jgi:hypothetical protein
VLTGSMLGNLVFGLFAVWLAYRWIDQLKTGFPPRPVAPAP